ncbi:uridine diphosphate glucose pyrophosphatase NUDT14-like [Venturia canescens]|uniref:uridine diphosphate glucose pyrophosphatase NUDT14-like n=1 Tax=Venturia canescens TaxID=32260 RepID=UPI001C9D40C5|nr:uridine diphosphate glucose pyrophosphatase NUDT14-like [Venturia canescens]
MGEKAQQERNEIVRKKMLDLRDFSIGPMPQNSPWLRPVRISFQQDGVQKAWDLMRAHESVSILIFNTTRKKLVFVRQFRPAAYYACIPETKGPVDTEKYPPVMGLTLELCAGIVDKDKSLVEIARDELREECGYEAPASAFSKIVTYRNVSTTATRHTLYYVEVTDDMHVHPGGGAEEEDELIEVVDMSVRELKNYIESDEVQSPPGFLFAAHWFLSNKKEHCS